MKNILYTNRCFISTSISLCIFLFFAACDQLDPDDQKSWPAEIATINADFISNAGAGFMLDLSGDTLDIDELGFCWGTTNPPTLDDNHISLMVVPGIAKHRAESLTVGTTYFMRGYYTFENRTYFSETVSFTTTQPVTDASNNEYDVVQVGDQLWMASNLKTSLYNNGEDVNDGSGIGNYSSEFNPKYFFYYDDDDANDEDYGKLYTWYAVTDNRGLCPAGWIVPDVTDWETMIFHLDALATLYDAATGGNQELSAVAGGMIRATGTIEAATGLWNSPNSGATNEAALNVIPNGLRDPSGAFDGAGFNAAFWSYSERDPDNGLMFYTHYFNPGIHVNTFSKSSGYAVRCVKNLQ